MGVPMAEIGGNHNWPFVIKEKRPIQNVGLGVGSGKGPGGEMAVINGEKDLVRFDPIDPKTIRPGEFVILEEAPGKKPEKGSYVFRKFNRKKGTVTVEQIIEEGEGASYDYVPPKDLRTRVVPLNWVKSTDVTG